jgi:ribonuclease HI
MNSKPLNVEDPTNWNDLEKEWMASFNLKSSKPPTSAHRSCWQLHNIQNIEIWIQKQQVHTLCFDGASKGNPGEAGAGGGVLFKPRGKRNLNYHWNIGMDTNNKVEAYALLKGIQLTQTQQIRELNALGDSKNIIRMMVHGSNPRYLSLKQVMDRIRVESQDIKITFYHIIRENYKESR